MINEKELEYRDNEIIVIEKKSLTWRQITNYKSQLSGKITNYYNQLQNLNDEANLTKNKIESLELELKQLNSKEVEHILEQQKEAEKIAHQRALDLLRNHIGLEAYTELMEKHRIYWTTKNNIKYRMTDRGQVHRRNGKKWEKLCIIKPKSMPLPDSILAILTSVKDNPKRFPKARR